MEPKFQSSFIPKKPAGSGGPGGEPLGLFTLISIIIFVAFLLTSAGVFGWQLYLKGKIEKMHEEIVGIQSRVDQTLITRLTQVDKQMQSADSLLEKHISITEFMEILQKLTVVGVRFNDFKFTETEGVMQIAMRGEAPSYSAVALQSQELVNSGYLHNVIFSDLDMSELGNVVFSMRAIVDQKAVSFIGKFKEVSVNI